MGENILSGSVHSEYSDDMRSKHALFINLERTNLIKSCVCDLMGDEYTYGESLKVYNLRQISSLKMLAVK